MLKKIVLIGPESSGKSTLCQQLANHYNTTWVPEYARKYLLKNGTDYSYDDLLTIAKEQVNLEDQILSAVNDNKSIAFIDTEMYVMKVWCEFVFQECHSWILNRIVEQKYDLYLLCNIDLPWIKDELREYPDLYSRLKLYNFYKDIMINQNVPWIDISGNYDERLKVAIGAIDRLHS